MRDDSWLTADMLKAALVYEPETGRFTWACGRRRAGMQAGKLNTSGHRQIMIEGSLFLAHRLAWLYVNGAWPDRQIDHVNGVRDDNRLANLRQATHEQNAQNRRVPANNTSGVKGVSWYPTRSCWMAHITANHRRKTLGYFPTIEQAAAARADAAARLHGDFAKVA